MPSGGGEDTKEHLVVCNHEMPTTIIGEVATKMGVDREEAKRALLMDEESIEKLKSLQCVALAHGHKRLWKARMKLWKLQM